MSALPRGIEASERARHRRLGHAWCSPCQVWHVAAAMRSSGGCCRQRYWQGANAAMVVDGVRTPARWWRPKGAVTLERETAMERDARPAPRCDRCGAVAVVVLASGESLCAECGVPALELLQEDLQAMRSALAAEWRGGR